VNGETIQVRIALKGRDNGFSRRTMVHSIPSEFHSQAVLVHVEIHPTCRFRFVTAEGDAEVTEITANIDIETKGITSIQGHDKVVVRWEVDVHFTCQVTTTSRAGGIVFPDIQVSIRYSYKIASYQVSPKRSRLKPSP
jgi:hypothetical protein